MALRLGDDNHRKSFRPSYLITMANSPVDRNTEMMEEQHGTRVLITDPAADRYLEKAEKENPNQDKFTKFCGGKDGWSDFTERWH